MDNYQMRKNRLAEEVDTDYCLITDPTNVYFFTGVMIRPHERMLALLLNTKEKKSALIYPALDEAFAERASVDECYPVSDGEDAFAPIFNFCSSGSLGIEGDVLTFNRFQRLVERFDARHIVAVDRSIHQLRAIKDKEDAVNIQVAVDMTEKALEDMTKQNVVGMTEREIADFLVKKLKSYGAIEMSFGPIVLTGKNSSLPHGVPGDTKVKQGDFLLVDFGVVTKDYYVSDITRTFIIGEPTDKQKDIYEAVLRANEIGVKHATVNQVIGELDTLARREIEASGYGEYFTHRLGHGLGLGLHEGPSMDVSNSDTLERGNVVTIEPGIYIPDYGGVRIEDMVYVDDTVHVFTSFPKDIESITLTTHQ